MSQILKAQITKLMTAYPFKVDGGDSKSLSETTKEVTFTKTDTTVIQKEVKVTFADYFINGFPGFDFHDKFNQGIAPPSKVMFGVVIKSTEKMFYLQLHSNSNQTWIGWCPRKSCIVEMR